MATGHLGEGLQGRLRRIERMLELPPQTDARESSRPRGRSFNYSHNYSQDYPHDYPRDRSMERALAGNSLDNSLGTPLGSSQDMGGILQERTEVSRRGENTKPGVWPWVVGATAALALASSVNSDLINIKTNLTASIGAGLRLQPALPGDSITSELDGRDLTLSGQIAGEGRRSQLVEELRSIAGIRVVRDEMQAFDARKQAKVDKLAFQQALETMDSSAIAFEPSSSSLSSQSIGALKNLASLLSASSNRQIKITGHTDNSGNPQVNLRISRERAQSVANALINMGVLQQQLIVQGFGHTQPLYSNDTETGRAKNRRIEFIFMK